MIYENGKRSARKRHHHAFCYRRLVWVFGVYILSGTKSSVSWLDSENDKAIDTSAQECKNAVSSGVKRLTARGCGTFISYDESGANPLAGAPTDGSCSLYHANGGGIKPCSTDLACMKKLYVGQKCNGLIFAGNSGTARLYVSEAEGTPTTFNNGSIASITLTGRNEQSRRKRKYNLSSKSLER